MAPRPTSLVTTLLFRSSWCIRWNSASTAQTCVFSRLEQLHRMATCTHTHRHAIIVIMTSPYIAHFIPWQLVSILGRSMYVIRFLNFRFSRPSRMRLMMRGARHIATLLDKCKCLGRPERSREFFVSFGLTRVKDVKDVKVGGNSLTRSDPVWPGVSVFHGLLANWHCRYCSVNMSAKRQACLVGRYWKHLHGFTHWVEVLQSLDSNSYLIIIIITHTYIYIYAHMYIYI